MAEGHKPLFLLEFMFGESAEAALHVASDRLQAWAEAFEAWMVPSQRSRIGISESGSGNMPPQQTSRNKCGINLDRLWTWADAFDGPALQPITFFAQSQSQKFALLTYRRSRVVEQLGLGVNFVTSNRSFTYRCLCSGTAIQNLQLV